MAAAHRSLGELVKGTTSSSQARSPGKDRAGGFNPLLPLDHILCSVPNVNNQTGSPGGARRLSVRLLLPDHGPDYPMHTLSRCAQILLC